MPKYRVIAGSHSHAEYKDGPKKGKPIIFRQGDVFEHPNPRFHIIHKNKFEPVDESTPLTSLEWVELDVTRMDEGQVREYAALNDIDLGSATKLGDLHRLVARWFKAKEEAKAKQKPELAKVK